ncbi:MAG TPA: hypothetical protein VMF08_11195 [Candidatus Sulfotelmatobacter sp.]|nr:hypothetical protein [Candidatus Sulfotelmatobacter sp.]
MKAQLRCLFLLPAILFGVFQTKATTIFPIATNANFVEMAGNIASSGSNYLVGIAQNQTVPFVQLLSSNGALVESPVNLGSSEGSPLVAFGKTNYLAFWAGDEYVQAQLISASGTAVGSVFNLPASDGSAETTLAFDGTNYLIVWEDEGSIDPGIGAFYGQLVTPAGALSGSPFLIGSTLAGPESNSHAGLVFGATNYLFAWQETNSVSGGWNAYGTFVSRNGSVSSPFQISQISSLDYDPPSAAFDGTNFFVVMNIDTNRTSGGGPVWNIYGRLVSQSGTFPGSEVLLNTNQSTITALAFDGANYLLTWGNNTYSTNTDRNSSFQFYNRSGSAIGPVFTPFQAQGTNTPLFSGLVFDGSKFAVGTIFGSLIVGADGSIEGLASGLIYGTFIPASTTAPTLTASNLAGTQFPLQLTGTPGIDYAIQISTNLALSNWTTVITNTPTNGIFSFTDASATNESRFYRAVFQ